MNQNHNCCHWNFHHWNLNRLMNCLVMMNCFVMMMNLKKSYCLNLIGQEQEN